ncbi:hypothetical protein [Mariniflexile sp. AS56]|uniref:hypothetical protein n=1 Tax=Mariniflexile sp. AS56 TaxID=3063957 RepID=UPI0026F1E2AC|nr:hypothetical protein [Mariniflexile sp. AS56]MDO7173831.1 hypothetical protein [Mariniflexile sp. AS56]
MRKRYLLSFLVLFCSLFLGYGQVLTIIEKESKRVDTVKINSAQIIDINSSLEIKISKSELIKKLRSNHSDFNDQLDFQERIDALEKVLTNQETLLKRLQLQTLNADDKKSFYEDLDAFYKSLLDPNNEGLRYQANALFEEWRVNYGPRSSNPNSGLKKEVYILSNFNKDLSLIKQNLANATGKSFKVSMIAYVYNDLGKNRVHIENFDIINEREIYSIPRWVTTLSQKQSKQLQELQKRAEAYNKEAPKYFASFKAALLSKLPDLSCIVNLKSEIQNFNNSTNLRSTIKTALKEDVEALITEINDLTSLVSIVSKDIADWKIDTPFEIITQTNTLAKSVDNIDIIFAKFKKTTTAFVTIKSQVSMLSETYSDCYNTVSKEINGFTQALSILKNQHDRFNDNDEIGTEIDKFTLNDLPSTGYIKLLRSGPRQKGDELEVVLVLRLPQKETAIDPTIQASAVKNETIESRQMTMQLIGLRSETVVGIIMADSFNEKGFTPVTDKRFLYAPTAALLLKIGSRNSKLYNDFIDLGFGLAVSTPDFNTDGTPEFGAGFMLTAFKDILSLGINYNVTLDTPYWSFGINLPFNLPGIPINNPQ